jgi:hypothetical protein
LPCAFLWKSISTSCGKSFGERHHGAIELCTCLQQKKTSWRFFVDRTKISRELATEEKKKEKKKKGVKENLQMEKIWIKTEDWQYPPASKKKKNATYDYPWKRKDQGRSEKKQPKHCASLRQTPLKGDGRYHWGWVPCRMRCIEED